MAFAVPASPPEQSVQFVIPAPFLSSRQSGRPTHRLLPRTDFAPPVRSTRPQINAADASVEEGSDVLVTTTPASKSLQPALGHGVLGSALGDVTCLLEDCDVLSDADDTKAKTKELLPPPLQSEAVFINNLMRNTSSSSGSSRSSSKSKHNSSSNCGYDNNTNKAAIQMAEA